MTKEELQVQLNALEKESKKLEQEYNRKDRLISGKMIRKKLKYIEEHKPADVKRFQHIRVTLRVTEETVKQLSSTERNRKNRAKVGNIYHLKGIFNGYGLTDNLNIKPCLWDKSYSVTDEVVAIKVEDNQPQGHCSRCLYYKDGGCYWGVGKSSPRPVWKITDDMIICPRYEEIIPGGLWTKKGMVWPQRHCEATRVTEKDGSLKYHLYEGVIGRSYYCVYEEEYIKKYYTNNPKESGVE